MSTSTPLRFLWVGFDGSGSNPPTLALCSALLAAGHSVLYVGLERQRPYFTRNHIPFTTLPYTSAAIDAAGLDDLPAAMAAFMRHIIANPDHPSELEQPIATFQPDRLIIDCLMLGCMAALELRAAQGKPAIPSFLYYHSTVSGQTVGMDMALPAVNAMRATLGLRPVTDLYDAAKRSAVTRAFCVSVPGLETAAFLPRLTADIESGWLRYCGPQRPAPGSATHVEGSYETEWAAWKERLPWALDDPRPLVLVAFSTVPQVGVFDQRSRIQRALQALDGQHCRVLCTSARTIVDGMAVPSNAVVFPYIPHDQVLPLAQAIVTHGGHGTLIAAYLYGAPGVFLPNFGDQPMLAQHLHDLKAGIHLPDPATTPEQIREAVIAVLKEPQYKKGAATLQAEINEVMAPTSIPHLFDL